MSKTSSNNYDRSRVHNYVIEGCKLYGGNEWTTSKIKRAPDRRKDGQLIESGKVLDVKVFTHNL
jgi:hypothetical protein